MKKRYYFNRNQIRILNSDEMNLVLACIPNAKLSRGMKYNENRSLVIDKSSDKNLIIMMNRDPSRNVVFYDPNLNWAQLLPNGAVILRGKYITIWLGVPNNPGGTDVPPSAINQAGWES